MKYVEGIGQLHIDEIFVRSWVGRNAVPSQNIVLESFFKIDVISFAFVYICLIVPGVVGERKGGRGTVNFHCA